MKFTNRLYAHILDKISYELADKYKDKPINDRNAFLYEVVKAVNEASLYRKLVLWLFEPYKGDAVDQIYFECLYVYWVEVDFNENR